MFKLRNYWQKRICSFIGEGTSKVLAEFGEIYFSSIYNLSASVSHLFPIPLANYPKKRLKSGCYRLSVSGETQKVRQNIDYFIEMGIDVIAITNSEKHDCSTFNSHDPLLYNNREKFHCRRNVPTTCTILNRKVGENCFNDVK